MLEYRPLRFAQGDTVPLAATYQPTLLCAKFLGFPRSQGGSLPYSMTGFGAAEGAVAGGGSGSRSGPSTIATSISRAKLPGELAALEGELRERLRREFDRGHVAVQARWAEYPAAPAGSPWIWSGRGWCTARLRELQSALGLGGRDHGGAGRAPAGGAQRRPSGGAAEIAWAEVEPIVAKAATECRAMRAREGEALAAELRHRLDLLEASARAGRRRGRPERLVRERDRLRGRGGASCSTARRWTTPGWPRRSPFRPTAWTSPRSWSASGRTSAPPARRWPQTKPVGKQLGFLAQELGREVNTMGSKANDAEIAHEVIAMKGELEKFREQLENLE